MANNFDRLVTTLAYNGRKRLGTVGGFNPSAAGPLDHLQPAANGLHGNPAGGGFHSDPAQPPTVAGGFHNNPVQAPPAPAPPQAPAPPDQPPQPPTGGFHNDPQGGYPNWTPDVGYKNIQTNPTLNGPGYNITDPAYYNGFINAGLNAGAAYSPSSLSGNLNPAAMQALGYTMGTSTYDPSIGPQWFGPLAPKNSYK